MVKVSMLFEFKDNEEIQHFERFLKGHNIECKSLTILPNTEELYNTDDVFKGMIKKHKKDKKSINDYINNNK